MFNTRAKITSVGIDTGIKIDIACPKCDHKMAQTIITRDSDDDDEPSVIILTCFNSECDLEEKVYTIQPTFTLSIKDTEHYIRHYFGGGQDARNKDRNKKDGGQREKVERRKRP